MQLGSLEVLASGQLAGAEPSGRKYAGAPVHASVWVVGTAPQEWDLQTQPPAEGVRWFDFGQSAEPEALFELLAPFCHGLEKGMLDDLLTPDEIPANRRWHDGEVRLASSFGVYPPEGDTGWGRGAAPAASAVYQAVELLAGESWLITRWHEPCLYCGSELEEKREGAVAKDRLVCEATKRWAAGNGRNAGDLGVLLMHELALTYGPAHRHLRTALETWELNLYGIEDEAHDAMLEHERQLRSLWGARARLRDWLNPLNVSGLRRDCDKAWLPVEDHDEVKEVDHRVDDALTELSRLGDTLRHAFQLVHIKMSEARREQQETTQRHLEFMATALLVPTLIVGFYGANTWVPGDNRHWGFWVMVAAMAIFTSSAVMVVNQWHRRRRSIFAARRNSVEPGER